LHHEHGCHVDKQHERKEHERMAAAVLSGCSFTAIVTGLFNLSDSLSVPGGLLVGAAWGVVLGLIVGLIQKNDVVAAWFEDVLVVLGATAVAFAAAGGVMALLMLAGALEVPH
jgi:hypothetical protein